MRQQQVNPGEDALDEKQLNMIYEVKKQSHQQEAQQQAT